MLKHPIKSAGCCDKFNFLCFEQKRLLYNIDDKSKVDETEVNKDNRADNKKSSGSNSNMEINDDDGDTFVA